LRFFPVVVVDEVDVDDVDGVEAAEDGDATV
jgi:hypothetical protein